METRYAQLEVYFGLCDSDGVVEGRFDRSRVKSEWEERIFFRAMEVVRRHLDFTPPMVMVGFGYGIAKTVEDGEKLIKYAERKYGQRASPLILLDDCQHGKIRFRRDLKIEGFTEEQLQQLISELKEAGIDPVNGQADHLKSILDMCRDKDLTKLLQLRLNKVDLDEPWKKAITFH